MRRKLPIVLIALLFTLGLCVLLYPVVANMISKATSSAVISNYQSAMDDLGDEEREKMLERAREYNAALTQTSLYDPFGGDAEELSTVYTELLNIKDGVMGYVDIPKIHVYLPIYHGTSADVLENGIGHLENTSLPVGGENTHAVLSGHCGLPTSELFTNLDQLVLGDVFYIHVLGETLAYQVDKITVVEPYEIGDLLIADGGDYLTLLTCTPYGINTQRLLVRGTRIAYTEEKTVRPQALTLTDSEATIVPALAITGVALILALIYGIAVYRKTH